MPFKALGLDPKILQAIAEAGYTEPTPIQAAAIPPIIAGTDLIGIAQTGTGKTAAFTLPILTRLAMQPQRRGTQVLILAPTRELVVQIEENVLAYAKHLPLTIAKVFGGVGERPQIQALRSGCHIVIATPGRLLDLMNQGYGDFSGLQNLVLDEADRMLDMGFLPSIKSIVKQLPKKRQTLLFSATLSKEIEALTHEFQHRPKTVQIGRRSNPAETVAQWVYEVPAHLKITLLNHLLRDDSLNMVLVFTRTKHGADRVARKLEQTGVKCATLHANRSQNQRLKALADFKSGEVRVLVATDIAARGIDVDGISHVVNYDFPMHAEDYVHRIGRTGRAQAIGDAISFISPEDQASLRALEKFIGRGLVRKKADGFDYTASAPPRGEEPPRYRDPRARPQGQGRGGKPQGGQGDQKGQGEQQGGPPRQQGGKPSADKQGRPQSGGRDPRGQQKSKPQQRPPARADGQGKPPAPAQEQPAKRSIWRRLSGR
ncbi:ATP-dependent RNA helicase RhlE [Prosthecobacter debontii]|uniref:DEAD-box ATP-dependent RNA helicase RhpA n=1 Tax=Prosthecobacter debontii TaxID=48467 RepID=A0A1T4WET2_9BACT|nr:DEAD/DEAH box helicase [Prosthecobacter debontii]SKA75822.1 ATP-dependent RNA helicase RhlE [Prosthecobacter debontii]